MVDRLWDCWRWIALVLLAIGLSLQAIEPMSVPSWALVHLPSIRGGLAIRLLVGAKIVFGIVLVGSLIGAIVLGALFFQARRRGIRRPIVAHGLLFTVTWLIALSLAEGIAARWAPPMRSLPSPPYMDPELPSQFAETSDDGEVTLVVIGESSAAGFPFALWLSVGKIVAWQLGEIFPGRRFNALVLAQERENLEIQYRKLAGLRRRPSAVIVYCGHNEFSSRIPWSRKVQHYRDDRPSLWESVDHLVCGSSALCGLIERVTDRYRIELAPTSSAAPPLVDVPAYTPAEFTAGLRDFHRRLEAIAAFCDRVGALLILVVPPANDTGFEPLRSFLRPDTPRHEREAFEAAFRAARQREVSDPAGSIKQYRHLLVGQPGFAECHYRLARLLEKTGAWEDAYRQYIAARDLDGYPLRCVTAFQQAYLDVAKLHDCALVDGQALFHAIGPHGLLDDSLFNDAMHPSLGGHIALATGILDAMRKRKSFGWPSGVPTPAIDPVRCAAHFGMLYAACWRLVCECGEMFYGAVAKLRYDPSQCLEMQRAYQDAVNRISAGESPGSLGLPNVGLPAPLPALPAR